MDNILLVEDNPGYAQVGVDVLSSQRQVALARDYAEAMDKLTISGITGVVTDCFFPERTGSGERTIGKDLIERMAQSDPRESAIVEFSRAIAESVEFNPVELRKYAEFISRHSLGANARESTLVRTIVHIASTIGKNVATTSLVDTIGWAVERDYGQQKDYYGALRQAVLESEANQPLGIMVAEKAREMGLPLLLTTSTYHHDILTQPVQDYVQRQGWRLFDCGPGEEKDKSSRQFWERVARELK
ncbi:hypothetical protein HYT52_02040 [Candidatus Woesearchaeota archaeon]|nr:hypothetical protein [Candidatus Woesearchaeota archaeon]